MASDETTTKGSGHSGRVLVRMPQSLHAELVQTAEREGVSLNALITGALASAIGWRNGSAPNGDAAPTLGTAAPLAPASPAPASAAGQADANEPSAGPAPRRPWSSVALVVNVVVIALAAVVALALLVAALAQG